MTRTFHIKHDKNGYAVELVTEETQFKSLEKLMYRIARHFIDKGKIEELRAIKGVIEAMLVGL